MLLAVLLLAFGVSQAADSVAVWIYNATGDYTLDPASDTMYLLDDLGNPQSYQIWIGLENDVDLGGMSLGFRIWSDDGVTWVYDAQDGGWGPTGQNTGLQAVTVTPGSRLDPPSSAFDMTQLLVTEKNVDGMIDDTLVFGGVSMNQVLELGPMESMLRVHFTPGGVAAGEVKHFCVDSAFVPPAANWAYSNTSGTVFPPKIAPATCVVVAYDPLSDASGPKSGVPAVFSLDQNFPNPFNPSTLIKYSLERKCHVNISVFNILGQRVATLVDQELEAGPHQADWDGNDDGGAHAASGIYFYKMVTDDFVETRKMVLMR